MLQKLRENTSGWIAMVILGLLCIAFAFFGLEQYLFQQNHTFSAKLEAPPQWCQSLPSCWPVTMLCQREAIDHNEFGAAFAQTATPAAPDHASHADPPASHSPQHI